MIRSESAWIHAERPMSTLCGKLPAELHDWFKNSDPARKEQCARHEQRPGTTRPAPGRAHPPPRQQSTPVDGQGDDTDTTSVRAGRSACTSAHAYQHEGRVEDEDEDDTRAAAYLAEPGYRRADRQRNA